MSSAAHPISSDENDSYVVYDDSPFFRRIHNRCLNTVNPQYPLPSDADEAKRSELHNRMMQFVFGGKNYIGPVKEVLQFGLKRRILDLGTGSGPWAIEMADEFPRADVYGVDLAPIQPRDVPPNCTFEIVDLDQEIIPYPDDYFDLIHARSIHTGIRDYPRLLREIARLLRPGGMVLLIEPDLTPVADGVFPAQCPSDMGVPGWFAFWETYRKCLVRQGIDITVPQCLSTLLAETGCFENVEKRQGNIPVGFWPKDPTLLTVGQLQWMDYELFLPALEPFFLSMGIAQSNVRSLISDAQQDLYQPSVNISSRIHIVHGRKCL